MIPEVKPTTVPELKEAPVMKQALTSQSVGDQSHQNGGKKQTKVVIKEKILELRQKIWDHLQVRASSLLQQRDNPSLSQQQTAEQHQEVLQRLVAELTQAQALGQAGTAQEQLLQQQQLLQGLIGSEQLGQNPNSLSALQNSQIQNANPDTIRNVHNLLEQTQLQQQQINLLQAQIKLQNEINQVKDAAEADKMGDGQDGQEADGVSKDHQ